jgi:hypothetical protein
MLLYHNIVVITRREGTGPPRIFIPEAVTSPEVPKRLSDNAAEGWADQTSWYWALGYAGGPQVYVIRISAKQMRVFRFNKPNVL